MLGWFEVGVAISTSVSYSPAMPGRNIVKIFEEDSFYHVYNRGISKGEIFLTPEDYRKFEELCERALMPKPTEHQKISIYVWLGDAVEMHAYCLMPNHFHMLLYQTEVNGISRLIQSICTAYTLYFNKKYGRRGPLFEGRFRAVPIRSDGQLLHVSRYIHLNHKDFRNWRHSSYSDYLSLDPRSWLRPDRIMESFASYDDYAKFVQDYEQDQRALERIKHEMEKEDYIGSNF